MTAPPSTLPAAAGVATPATAPPAMTAPTDVLADIRRLAGVRWLSLATMALATWLLPPLLQVTLPLFALHAVMCGMAALNLFTLAWLAGATTTTARATLLQLLLDVLGWSLFLYFSGGATNPLISMLLPLVAIGAALLPAARAWLLAAVAAVAYSLLWQYYLPLAITDDALATRWHLAGMWLTFVLSAAVSVGFIVRLQAALRRRDAALAAASTARARDERIVALGNLAAGTAHNLGTPLGTMRILIDELQRTPPSREQLQEDLALLGSQVDACRRALALLAADAGQARAEGARRQPVTQWLRAAITQWQAQRPGHAVDLQADAGLDTLQLVVDATLTQALQTLVNNAADVQPAGNGEAIAIVAACHDGQLLVDVHDRGPGMDATQRARAGWQPATGTGGMGIGLFLARRALEHCGGELSFHAGDGGGTCARLRIPLARLSATEDAR